MQNKQKKANAGDLEDDIKEFFPAIYKELKESEQILSEHEARTSKGTKKIRKFRGYEPGVIDFICRCKTVDEAIEIINFLFERDEISEKEKEELLLQLKEEGLESFGPHRTPGYYERA